MKVSGCNLLMTIIHFLLYFKREAGIIKVIFYIVT